jgi:hypothetical protein
VFEQGASPHPPRNLYRSYLDQSHVFVAIYWQRYGWIGPDMDISGLEDEYRLSNGKPRLVYIKRPAPEREPGLEAMLDDIRDKAGISYKPFSTPAELEEVVSQDLVTLLSERFQTGRDQTTKRRIETRMRGPVPVPPSDLIGRDEELAALAELLVDDGTRLVTLTGPGGSARPGLPSRPRAAWSGASREGSSSYRSRRSRTPSASPPASFGRWGSALAAPPPPAAIRVDSTSSGTSCATVAPC